MNTDYAEKKGSQDHGATEMNKDIQAMYKIFKTNPKVKSDGSYQQHILYKTLVVQSNS